MNKPSAPHLTPSRPAKKPLASCMIAPLPEERSALALLSQAGAWCRKSGALMVVIAPAKNVSLRVGSFPLAIADHLIKRRWIMALPDGEGWTISEQGRHALKVIAQPHHAQAQHAELEPITLEDGKSTLINRDENTLARLARMKKHNGAPLLDAAAIEAGERLAADFMRAGMVPGVTMRWDATGAKGDYRAHPTELMIAARQRVEAALAFTGHELAGLLIDVLAFSKGVETIERDRHWPQRSGKILIALALSRLATHYGFAAQAQGSAHAATRAWQAPDARPTL